MYVFSSRFVFNCFVSIQVWQKEDRAGSFVTCVHATVVPTKSDSDVILCLQLLGKY